MKRRFVENFLLVPEAIANALNALPFAKHRIVSEEQVTEWIMKNGSKPKFIKECDYEAVGDNFWLENVDGASLLQEIFSHFSLGTEVLQWDRDCARIITWLADRDLSHFSELESLVLESKDNKC